MKTPPAPWCRLALELAWQKAPTGLWEPAAIYDFPAQRLALPTIEAQLGAQVGNAINSIGLAPLLWATTRRWPRLRKDAATVVRLAIQAAHAQFATVSVSDTTRATFRGPPWSAAEAEWLQCATVEAWSHARRTPWVESLALAEFRYQESLGSSYG